MAKPTKKIKDLSPKSGAVKGGGWGKNDNMTLVRAAKPTVKKDLPPSKDVKGGKKYSGNDNMTLVRAAKPKKDLPPRQDVKGGGKKR
jgi:hypothetical protein